MQIEIGTTVVSELTLEPMEANMFSNDLNNAYAYESERRNDERRAAAESQLLRGLGGKRKLSLPSSVAIIGILAALIAVVRIF